MIRFFNTLTRQKEEFVPIQKGKVKWYSCGPTVYNFAHIGNLSTFIFGDLLRRYLEYRGLEVVHVMNITDVDDKTINGAKRAGTTLAEFTEKYAQSFFTDLKALEIKPAAVYPRATAHIPEMIVLIKTLLKKGLAYQQKDGSIYYRIYSFPTYGKLAGIDPKNLKAGASGIKADEYKKEDVADFALWKAWEEEDGEVFWQTEIGKGRPGWHIECSAMSMKYLGKTLDIHTGGIDLVFPHHQNEIAQSEGATGQKFVNYWLHRSHLIVEGEKMSKRLGNMKTLKDIAGSTLDNMAFRYLVVSNHYRSPLNFTEKSFEAAKSTVLRLVNLYSALNQVWDATKTGLSQETIQLLENARKRFVEALDDDLDTPTAMAAVFEFAGKIEEMLAKGTVSESSAVLIVSFLSEIDDVIAVIENVYDERRTNLPPDFSSLIKEREESRAKKDYARADEIRRMLLEKNIQLEDTPRQGTVWRWTS